MRICGLTEKRRGRLLPACKEKLDNRGKCSVHCRAKLRGDRTGKYCVNRHVRGRRGCRMHGGNTPAGLGSKKLKTGEYSRYLPVLRPDMKKRFENAMRQSDILSLLPDICLLDARIEDNLSSEAGARLELQQVLTDMNVAIDSGDKDA